MQSDLYTHSNTYLCVSKVGYGHLCECTIECTVAYTNECTITYTNVCPTMLSSVCPTVLSNVIPCAYNVHIRVTPTLCDNHTVSVTTTMRESFECFSDVVIITNRNDDERCVTK